MCLEMKGVYLNMCHKKRTYTSDESNLLQIYHLDVYAYDFSYFNKIRYNTVQYWGIWAHKSYILKKGGKMYAINFTFSLLKATFDNVPQNYGH